MNVRTSRIRKVWWRGIAAAIPLLEVVTQAGLTSANYQINPTAFGGGASQSSSANYASFSGVAGFVVGTGTSAAYTADYGFFPSAGIHDVTGRFIFYNQSAFDGNSALANASDDNAIATDKTALLPGGSATFANYTSFSRGINGIMVDLPNGVSPTAADFTFKRGNTSTPGTWSVAPNPSSVTVRAGAGVAGADRVTLIWANNQIQKQWLEVTVLATANTGLSEPSTFYFGNAIGEANVGNTSPTRFTVTSADALVVINGSILSGAAITSATDFNRDRRVNSQDALIAINNSAIATSALLKLSLASGDTLLARQAEPMARVALADEIASPEVRFVGGAEVLSTGVSHWLQAPAGGTLFLEQNRDLTSEAGWEPVPADWVVNHGNGFYQVVMPFDGPQRFLRVVASMPRGDQ